MNIYEAVKIAVMEDRYITLPCFVGCDKIKPTNGKGNCIVMNADGSHPSKDGWQPTANDLLRTDWMVTE